MDKDQYELILHLLDATFQKNKRLEEKIDCILHVLCENDDDKTYEAIRNYLKSHYRNTQQQWIFQSLTTARNAIIQRIGKQIRNSNDAKNVALIFSM